MASARTLKRRAQRKRTKRTGDSLGLLTPKWILVDAIAQMKRDVAMMAMFDRTWGKDTVHGTAVSVRIPIRLKTR